MRRRVFISYVNDDPDTGIVFDALCYALEKVGFDVLVDRHRIAPGTAWRQEIYAWIGLCHAAVVLISRRALDDPTKPWVARETALLVWRQALDPALRLIPVLLPGVAPADLAEGRFTDLQLREIQSLAADADPSKTVGRVLEALNSGDYGSAMTPLDIITGQVAARLGHFDQDVVTGAAELLGLDLGRWRPAGNGARDLALALLCAPFEEAACALEHLAGYASKLDRGSLLEIAQILGANWVNPEAARWLAFDAPRGLAAVLNASTQFAAESYVQRACGRPPPARWPLVCLTGVTGEEAEVEIHAEVEAALARTIPLAPDAFGADPAVRRRRLLEQRRKQGLPTFLLTRLPADASAFLRALRTAHPWAAPLFLAAALTEADADALGATCRVLRPLLEAEADLEAQTRMDDLLFRLTAQG